MIRSPTFTKSGTCTTAPVSSVAGFVTFETVSPFTPGSVSVTSSTTDAGSSTPDGFPPTNITCTDDDGSEAHFMDEETFDQFGLPRAEVEEALAYLPPSSSVQMLAVDGKLSGIQLPASVELVVTETEPAVRGDTVTNVTKPATLETGAVVQVPLFVDRGERIKVDPREGRYISRA